jgi:hypothetical protein
MVTEQIPADTNFDTPPPIKHVYPYVADMVIRPGMKAICGYVYQGEPYDGTTADVEADCIVCEDLVRVKSSK